MKRPWPLFLATSTAVVAVLAWLSSEVLDLEAAETRALAEARYQHNLRLAMARLDAAGLRVLAEEASRPHDSYTAFHTYQQRAFTPSMQQIEQDQILTPSPILERRPEYVRLHFQIGADGTFSSPQVPRPAFAELSGLSVADVRTNAETLQHVCKTIEPQEFGVRLEEAESWTAKQPAKQRALAQNAAPPHEESVSIGRLEGIWYGRELYFIRRVEDRSARFLQGFLADREALERLLLEDVRPLNAAAVLAPVAPEYGADDRMLSMPYRLEAPAPPVAISAWTATHTVLALVWPTVLAAMAIGALALRRAMVLSDKQRRFASLVTHELRSPLTTFQLYTELLAEGLVTEEAKRTDYFKTLRKESDQMARTVANVITHARIEEGRMRLDRRRQPLGALLDELSGDLHACARKAGLSIAVESGGASDVLLETDQAAVGQILFNLVENACRYAGSEKDPAILVSASVHDGRARIAVRDHGAGVPAAVRKRIFRPFDRGTRDETAPQRGLGLGLALSRGLAKDLGGDLTLEHPADGGARFVLTLPVA